jgi:mono/diheme cytochrome c family protein
MVTSCAMKLPARSPLSRESLRLSRLLCAALLMLGIASPACLVRAHEVPRHVGVRAYVAPVTDRVRVLVQLPMNAVRDVDFPLRANDALDAARALPYLRDAARLWVADGLRLRDGARDLGDAQVVAVRAALPSDRAFEQYARALAAVRGAPFPADMDVPHGQLSLEVLLEVPLVAPVRDLVIEPHWAHLGVRTTSVVRLVNTDGSERAYTFDAAARFVSEGVGHMLGGIDHLLFVLCLVLPFRHLRPLIGIVTAFTVAHSITLVASALGYAPGAAWFAPLVEVLIAASIVYMALENILGPRLERRWLVAFVFGLVHGFGFSAALGDTLQFAGRHLLVSLAAFNVGVELAQVSVLLLAVPLLERLFTRAVPERAGIVVASALVAHEAWHWMTARAAELRGHRFAWPTWDMALLSALVQGAMAVLCLVGVAWLLQGLMARLQRPGARPDVGALGLAVLLIGGGVAATGGALGAQQAPRTTMGGAYTAEQAVKGREVFNGSCLGCHTTASHMGPAFQLKWFGRPLYDLYDYVSQAMPKSAPGSLTEDEYVWVTAYILRLNGMPPGKIELSPEPAWLKAVRVDSTVRNGTREGRPPRPR